MHKQTFSSVWAPIEGSVFTANAREQAIQSHKALFYLGAYEFLRLMGTIPAELDEAASLKIIEGYGAELRAELIRFGFQVPS